MAELRIDEASRKALEERLRSPEGQEIMSRLARIIVESALEHMPPEMLQALNTKEGEATFRDVWPDIVDGFLFRRSRPRGATEEAVQQAKSGSRMPAPRRRKRLLRPGG